MSINNQDPLKYLTILLVSTYFTLFCSAQGKSELSQPDFYIIKPPPTSVVEQHKNDLSLTLIVDSIKIGQKKILPNFTTTISISFESDYIQINDSLFLKIFISRNQEYGRKFYSWKWDFLKKKTGQFYSQGVSMYEVMDFNGSLDQNGSLGHGVGIEGRPGFIMYYYRYKLQ